MQDGAKLTVIRPIMDEKELRKLADLLRVDARELMERTSLDLSSRLDLLSLPNGDYHELLCD